MWAISIIGLLWVDSRPALGGNMLELKHLKNRCPICNAEPIHVAFGDPYSFSPAYAAENEDVAYSCGRRDQYYATSKISTVRSLCNKDPGYAKSKVTLDLYNRFSVRVRLKQVEALTEQQVVELNALLDKFKLG